MSDVVQYPKSSKSQMDNHYMFLQRPGKYTVCMRAADPKFVAAEEYQWVQI